MSEWDGEHTPRSVRTAERPRPHRPEDVMAARRGVATFGAQNHGGRTVADTVRDFIARYGWRAYALPVLVVITIVALLTAGTDAQKQGGAANAAGSHQQNAVAPPAASGNISLKSDQPGAGAQNTVLPADALPSGGEYTKQGTGTFRVLAGTGPVVGTGTVHRYSVDVENGITGIDLTQFASLVQSVLTDSRSWAGHGGLAVQRVDSGRIDFHVTLTSSLTVRNICGYDIPIETSCFVQAGSIPGLTVSRVIINNSRWVRGDAAYVGDRNAYREYLINHEVGHALGHMHAHQCLPAGLAPVMMQQTLGLKSATTGKMCQANPWPYPPNVAGVPGAEQPDNSGNSEYSMRNS